MPRVSIDTAAPDFTLPDYTGVPFSLSEHRGEVILLVFNRGFA